MPGVFRTIDPPPTPSPPGECVPPPPLRIWCGRRTHSLGGEGVGVQKFGRRQTLLCTLYTVYKYFVVLAFRHILLQRPYRSAGRAAASSWTGSSCGWWTNPGTPSASCAPPAASRSGNPPIRNKKRRLEKIISFEQE
jgi:hypothetical protein